MSDLVVEYVSRGILCDVATVRGPEIDELGRGHFSTGGTVVPYHRILRILRGGEVLFDRAVLREGRQRRGQDGRESVVRQRPR